MLKILLTVLLLSFSFPSFSSASEEQPATGTFHEQIAEILTELTKKFDSLSEEAKQFINELIALIKNALNDPNPAASVPVEGTTKKNWDSFNSTSPEEEERNRKIEEDNKKRIGNM